uniref:ParB/RepB/Spo0J family partition protein n=1 Tax=Janibacter massiliensis TaxID=2058291 RepID=UPI00131A4F42
VGDVADAFRVIRLDDVHPHPDNPRRDVGDVTDLAASIREKGLLEPIVVAHPPTDTTTGDLDPDALVLLAGHRRTAAAREAGLTEVPAIVRADLTTRAQQVETMIVENQHRADLSPIEEAEAFQLLLDLGETQPTIAARTGLPRRRVRDRLKLHKLPDTARDLVHTGQATITDALAVLDVDAEHHDELLAHLGTPNFDARCQWAKRETQRRKDFEKLEKDLLDAGWEKVNEDQLEGPDAIARREWLIHGQIPYTYDPDGVRRTAQLIIDNEGSHDRWVIARTSSDRLVLAKRIEPAESSQSPSGDTITGSDEDLAAASARAEREARLESDMTVAAKHLRDYLLAPDVDTHLLLSEALATDEVGERSFHGLSIFDGRDAWTSTSTVLDLDPDLDHDDRDAAVSEALVGLGPDRAAVALWLLRANPWPGDGYEHLIYVDALNRAGHAWTDLEREHHGLDENGNLPTPDTDEDGDQ